jgi:hypothetical protein
MRLIQNFTSNSNVEEVGCDQTFVEKAPSKLGVMGLNA